MYLDVHRIVGKEGRMVPTLQFERADAIAQEAHDTDGIRKWHLLATNRAPVMGKFRGTGRTNQMPTIFSIELIHFREKLQADNAPQLASARLV